MVVAVQQLEADRCATGVVVEPDPVAKQHRRDVKVDLVDQAQREQLPADGGGEDLEVLPARGFQRDAACLGDVAADDRELLASESASPAAIESARAALATPPTALAQRIGARPENPLDRGQWARAAVTLIRTVELPTGLDLPAPEVSHGLDMGL